MNKKVLISIVAVLITLATISTFVDFSKDMTGEMVAPIARNAYAVLTILLLIGISVFVISRND